MRRTIALHVNGRPEEVEIQSHWTLVQLLREGLQMLGTEEGCGEGSCGSCTVMVDGELVRSCLYLAVRAEGRNVQTVEGLAHDGELDPLQRAFVQHGAVQCGFCTPGFLMSAEALLRDHPDPTDQEIREYLSGNFCRCGGYTLILAAVRDAAATAGAAGGAAAEG
ncbi:MAG: (2Fe-2S)-binding protein [Actinomycetota bacterium]|nr:(2Fe-2S)-binding protein [Actinomycetota bacterium]